MDQMPTVQLKVTVPKEPKMCLESHKIIGFSLICVCFTLSLSLSMSRTLCVYAWACMCVFVLFATCPYS